MASLPIKFTSRGATVASRRSEVPLPPVETFPESSALVCPRCAKKNPPQVAALLTLAAVARRVGKMKRHTLTPPLEALLELARAAEDYAYASGREEQAA